MQPTTPQAKKTLIASPKVNTGNVSKRPISELGTFKSPSKVLKAPSIKELPNRSK